MSGASAIYLEQGFDQFFKPGPGEQPFQLNPLGRITDEFMRFAEKHPGRGTPYTPVAFLLDPAHGWEMTDYPQWPFEVSQINRSDRALRELFTAAYYPGGVVEGEPATGDRQAFVSGVCGDIFDVLVATRAAPTAVTGTGVTGTAGVAPAVSASGASRQHSVSPADMINSYRAVIVGGSIAWTSDWASRLSTYVRNGGVVVLNAAQTKGLSAGLLGVRLLDTTAEADNARCLAAGEPAQDLTGQLFRYEKVERMGSEVLIEAPSGDPLVTVNKVGKGKVIFCAVPDLLGEDERFTPLAAHLLTHLVTDATPIKVSGDVEYLINRTDTGWVVTLFNNNGVFKPQQGLAQIDRNANATTTISVASQAIDSAGEWISEAPMNLEKRDGRSTVKLKIAPGGVAIVELIVHH
jgi:hypothetical protein